MIAHDTAFAHQACIYGSDDEFLAMAVPFIADGLVRDEAVLAVTTPANIELLARVLGADADRVEFVDAGTWYGHPATTLAAYDQYVAKQRGRTGHVRIIGEPVWPERSDLLVTEWKRYESVLNVVFAASPAWIVCPYDSRALAPSIVHDARRTHPGIMVGQTALPCPEFADPAEFFGICDRAPLPEPPPSAAMLPFAFDLRSVRRFVATQAERHGLSGDVATLFVAAVGEVVTYLMDQGGDRATVQLWAWPGEVVCEVHDHAVRVTDPFLGYRPPDLEARPDDGLWLTRQVTDLMEVRPGDTGTTVRLHVSLPQAELRPAQLGM